MTDIIDFPDLDICLNPNYRGRPLGAKNREKLRDEFGNVIKPAKELKEFLAWDGEGVTHKGRNDMSYVLFGHHKDACITGRQLTTRQILNFIIEQGQLFPNDKYIHVSYGFGFDVSQILRDIPENERLLLKETTELHWEGYGIQWIKGKWFSVHRGQGTQVKIYDTISFFDKQAMITACKQYLGNDHPLLEAVSRGKDQRKSFEYVELHTLIKPYWEAEGKLMAALLDKLRESLIGADLPPDRDSWHGPGSVANTVLKRYGVARDVQESRENSPTAVLEASSYAFSGGHIEQFLVGDIPGPIYSYDIRSAYPAALARMPAIWQGEWVHTSPTKSLDDIKPDGIYRASLRYMKGNSALKFSTKAYPLPYHNRQALLFYPHEGASWWYGHEIIAATETGYPLTIHEGWHHTSELKPWEFVQDLYNTRRDMKKAKDPAQYGVKIGLNSIYGKLAQRIQSQMQIMNNLPPTYHNQYIAGNITSFCRAMIWKAIADATETKKHYGTIISVETDGIYSRVPLNHLPIGDELGQWELTVYDRMVSLQSGCYLLWKDGKPQIKMRGAKVIHNPDNPLLDWATSNDDGITLNNILKAERNFDTITGTAHHYGSMTNKLGKDQEYTWFDEERSFGWAEVGKRIHDPNGCWKCLGHTGYGADVHNTRIDFLRYEGEEFSKKRKLPWVDNDFDEFDLMSFHCTDDDITDMEEIEWRK